MAAPRDLIALDFLSGGPSLASFLHHSFDAVENEMVATAVVLSCQRKRKAEEPTRIKGFVENIVPRYTDINFKEHFRMTRSTFEDLLTHTAPMLDCRSKCPDEKLLSFIWMLGNKESYRGVADRFGISKSTLRRNMSHVASALKQLGEKYIKWPHSQRELEQLSRKFKFSGAIGCIDGTYIPMLGKGGEKRDAYFCRKGFPAMHAQVVCDNKLVLLGFSVGYPGSVHDACVFRNSHVCQFLKKMPPYYHVLGDSAYPLESYLLTPFRDNGRLTAHQAKFNRMHATYRSCVERCIGLLKGNFVD